MTTTKYILIEDNLPTELKRLPQWVLWRYEKREGKLTKSPFDCNGDYASSTDAETWADYDTVRKAYSTGSFDGIGFVVTPTDKYCGVDLDHCRNSETGEITQTARDIITRLNSYTEITPSLTGIRIWIKAKLPQNNNARKRKTGIEIYDQERFFTVTGNHLDGTPNTIQERQKELNLLHAELFPPEPKENKGNGHRAPTDLADTELLSKAMAARNGDKFRQLWEGDTSAYGGDDSAADLALCSMLAFWTENNESRIDSLFRQSRLYREKWDRQDYRERTIKAAINGNHETYKKRQQEQHEYKQPPSPRNGHHDGDEIANTVNLVWMNTVKAEAIEWLWKPYIPLGKLTMLEGDPGVGKSWILLALATAVSLGKGLPKVETVPQGIVLMASAEDGKADTIRPRLNDMGADTTKIVIIDDPDAKFTLDDAGCDMLEQFINQVKPLVVILDPMVAFINADVDISQANQMRHITKKLANIAEKYHIAIIALRHLTKGGSSKPIYRGLGSIDITAAARSVLMAGEDPETGTRGIMHIKSNLAPKGDAIGYELTDKFYWSNGDCDLTVERILATDSGGMPKDKAKVFLDELLKDGALAEKQIKEEAETQDISPRTLKRVKKELGIHSFNRPVKGQRGAGAWYWELPIDNYEKEPNS